MLGRFAINFGLVTKCNEQKHLIAKVAKEVREERKEKMRPAPILKTLL